MANMKPCAVCGQIYEVCPVCEEIAVRNQYAPWKTMFCCWECYQIYEVLRQLSYNLIDIDEAQSMLLNVDIPTNIVKQNVKDKIAEILAHESKPKISRRKSAVK